MIIEIRKAGFVNKGAELMLHAIVQKLTSQFSDAQLVMSPSLNSGSSPYIKRAKLGFYQKAFNNKVGYVLGGIVNTFAHDILEKYGVILDKDVDIILDAAGFAYSDQWGTKNCRKMAELSSVWKKNGKKIILLPQAFGPFKKAENIKNIKRIVANCDLIFAREKMSYEHLIGVVGEQDKIKISPDFTNLIQGCSGGDYSKYKDSVFIVPNYRMVDKTDSNTSKSYTDFLTRCTGHLLSHNETPVFLVHEGENDFQLAQNVINQFSQEIEIIRENDPLKIKAILGSGKATIGSRFHGLVSALSQGVPSLAAGWSHKYEMLFDDYNFSEGVVDVNCTDEVLTNKIDRIISEESHTQISNDLKSKSFLLKEMSEDMWKAVFQVIES